eukprot:CAMPEP_0182616952 /NCGR_PEP_ID=MMETSP1330-20130603/40231_1 /TAXON_ID=464278 /ORGANISM="Picochlorum sp., Strain RCC944" /LENGTH=98 /DNA_ID=CAMNT_0024837039 /DNA_START=382 /DNA_END=678 /DNA_ORIENTATION=-
MGAKLAVAVLEPAQCDHGRGQVGHRPVQQYQLQELVVGMLVSQLQKRVLGGGGQLVPDPVDLRMGESVVRARVQDGAQLVRGGQIDRFGHSSIRLKHN